MATVESLLPLLHLLGLGLALGSATAKLTLLWKSGNDLTFLPGYIAAAGPLTRLILTGTALLVLSGITWLVIGYPLGDILIIKLVLVGLIIVLGATMDNVIEPRFRKMAPQPGESPSPEFLSVQKRYLLAETAATGLFYVIVILWVMG